MSQITTVNFFMENKNIVVEGVPANVCQRCGEKYFDEVVYEHLERLWELSSSDLQPASGSIHFQWLPIPVACQRAH